MYKCKLNSKNSAVALIGMEIIMLVVQLITVSVLEANGVGDYESYWITLVATQLSILVAGASVLFLARVEQGARFSDFRPSSLSLGEIGLLVAGAVGVLFFSAPVASLFSEWLVSIGVPMPVDDHTFTSLPEFLLGLAFLCVLPAVVEEFFTRGVLLSGLVKIGLIPAIFISAFCFAIMHGNPFQLIHQFVLGAVMAYVVIVSGNLLASVIIHFTNNFLAVGLTALTTSSLSGADVESAPGDPVITAITFVIMMSIGAYVAFVALRRFTQRAILKRVHRDPQKKQTYVRYSQTKSFFSYTERLGEWQLDLADGPRERISPLFYVAVLICLGVLALNTASLILL